MSGHTCVSPEPTRTTLRRHLPDLNPASAAVCRRTAVCYRLDYNEIHARGAAGKEVIKMTGRATHGAILIVFGFLLNAPPLAAADSEMTQGVLDLHGI
jgi:hypothetical protein